MLKSLKSAAFGLFVLAMFVPTAFAQIGGTGWTTKSVKFNVQSPTNAPQNARYFFTNNIYHCLTYSNDGAFSVGNTTLPRTEQRFTPDYTNGEIQYQSVEMCPSNENSYCVFQIHTGDAQSPTYGSTTFMLFWFTNYGGSVHDYSGTTLATNLGNQWFQLNVDHNVATGTIRVWVNQKLVWTQQDNGAGDFYFKDGVYEQSHNPTLQMDTYITNSIKMWTSSGTNPPAPPAGLTATPTFTRIGLAWNSSVGATNYNLKRSTISGGSYATIASLTGTSYTDTNVIVGPTYYYVVTAADSFGESANSTQAGASLINTGYQLSAAPLSQSLAAGSSTNFTMTMTTNGNFSGSVVFGVAGLPGGADANFSPPSLDAPGTSTLTINTVSNTAGGNYILTIGGTNGSFIVTTNVTLSLNGVISNPGTLLWTGNGVGINWSTVLNWTNITAGGNGPPGLSNDVLFVDTSAALTSNTVNNAVNGDTTIRSLAYSNTNGFHTTQIATGNTLTITGTNGMLVGTETDNGGNQAVSVTFTNPGGTLDISNPAASLIVRQGTAATGGSQRATLDLSGLGTINGTLGRVLVGFAGPIFRATGTLYLGQTNTITVSGASPAICAGDNSNNGGGQDFIYLGQSNSIFADSITIGRRKSAATLAFNSHFINPSAYFRGSDGVSRVASWTIGDASSLGGSSTTTAGTNDFSLGSIDASVDTMKVGVGQASANEANAFGTLTFASGTIDLNTLQVGVQTQSGSTNGNIGQVNINGADALLNVRVLLELGYVINGGTSNTVGTLNVNGGTVQATNIVGGGGTSTINLDSGTMDLQGAGQIANVSTLNIGTPAASDPALLASAAAISVSNAIVIAPNGTLAGNTVITSPGLTVNGTLSPGTDGAGWMTNNGPLTLGAGGEYVVTVQDAAAGSGVGWSFLQAGKGINVQATNGNQFTMALQTVTGSAANFNYNTNYDWVIATANNGITNFNANSFAADDSLFANDLAGGYFHVRTNGNSLIVSFANNHPPVAGTAAFYRTGTVTTIPISNLAGNWSDPDGDPVAFASVNASSGNGTNNVSTDGVYIYYTNAGNAADTIGYTVQDVRTNPPAVYRPGDTVQTATGTVAILPPPSFAGSPALEDGNLVFGGGGGVPDQIYYVLASTNAALPVASWTVLATNSFDGNGNFNFTNAMDANQPQLFYLLKLE